MTVPVNSFLKGFREFCSEVNAADGYFNFFFGIIPYFVPVHGGILDLSLTKGNIVRSKKHIFEGTSSIENSMAHCFLK